MNHPLKFASYLLAALFLMCGWSFLRPTAAEAVPIKPQTYQVQPGDSLYRIAQNNATDISALKTVNSMAGDQIIPGEILILPGPALDGYWVRPGDYLYAIAQKFHTSVTAIIRLNQLASTVLMPGQSLSIPEQTELLNDDQSLGDYLVKSNRASFKNMQIVVHKNDHTLSLYEDAALLKTYPVSLGDGGLDPKKVAGDHKTPEGYFYIVEKSVLNPEDPYLGTRWMRLGYPNSGDAVRGIGQNLIDNTTYPTIIDAYNQKQTPPQNTPLGGGVGIHGGSGGENTGDWTWGCLGLDNEDIEEFYDYVPAGAPVIIVR